MTLLWKFLQEDYGQTESITKIKLQKIEAANKYNLMLSLEDFHAFEWDSSIYLTNKKTTEIFEDNNKIIVDVFWDPINRLVYHSPNNIPWENWFWI